MEGVKLTQSKSLPDSRLFEALVRKFSSSVGMAGRSCSLQDSQALREAYSSSECDSTSSSSSSSESLSSCSSSDSEGSDDCSASSSASSTSSSSFEGSVQVDSVSTDRRPDSD
uniref:CHM n=1 Tax=Macrostomum lignano TaxID=282301 RepID=A0A1I8HHE2_9PLAT